MSGTPVTIPSTAQLLGGRYEPHEELGRGAAATVYRALDTETRTWVALKHFHRQGASKGQFLRELGGVTGLRHPSIVEFHTVLMAEGGRYLVFELCDRGSLRQALHEGKSSEHALLSLMRGVCDGVGHAHHAGVIHRDIKPENILLTTGTGGNTTAKVTDFGIAGWVGPPRGVETTGSPAYMAPERFYEGDEPSGDLYALGVVLYEIVCGYRPFRGDPQAIIRGHLFADLELPDWLPAPLRSLLQRGLARDSADRFQSAHEMRLALDVSLEETTQADFETSERNVRIENPRGLAIHGERVYALGASELNVTDRRGRLIRSWPGAECMSASAHGIAFRDAGPGWTRVTLSGSLCLSSVPEDATVATRPKDGLVYVSNGGLVSVDAGRVEVLRPEGATTIAADVGRDGGLWIVVRDEMANILLHGDRRWELPFRPATLSAHHELDAAIVTSARNPTDHVLISGSRLVRFQLLCGGFSAVDNGFATVGPGNQLMHVDTTNGGRVTAIPSEAAAFVATGPTITATLSSSGTLSITRKERKNDEHPDVRNDV